MRTLRRAGERGHAHHGWLESFHTFSFADYYDPAHMGFRALRVINDDRVAPGEGFGTHPHRDMEIVSYVLEGALAHRDSMGHGSTIRPGDVQRMSAGTGVSHSEFNASASEPVHFLQIWLLPRAKGLAPGYEQRHFDRTARQDRWRLIASPDGADGSVTVNQDARIYAALLSPGASVVHPLAPGRHAWLHVASGRVEVDGTTLEAGDGLALTDEAQLAVAGREPSELLLFELT